MLVQIIRPPGFRRSSQLRIQVQLRPSDQPQVRELDRVQEDVAEALRVGVPAAAMVDRAAEPRRGPINFRSKLAHVHILSPGDSVIVVRIELAVLPVIWSDCTGNPTFALRAGRHPVLTHRAGVAWIIWINRGGGKDPR